MTTINIFYVLIVLLGVFFTGFFTGKRRKKEYDWDEMLEAEKEWRWLHEYKFINYRNRKIESILHKIFKEWFTRCKNWDHCPHRGSASSEDLEGKVTFIIAEALQDAYDKGNGEGYTKGKKDVHQKKK